MVSSHPSEPMVNERGLSNPSPGNDGNDVDILVRPCLIQESDILLPAKNIASRNRQSSDRNLLRTQSSRRLARVDARSRRGCPLQALTRDSAPRIDSACYRRYRLQKFCGSLKSAPGILLEEYLKEKDGRLWNSL